MRGKATIVRLLIALGLLLAPSVAALTAASPAQAAASCYGDYCSGKNPATTGTNGNPCQNGARTVAIAEIYANGGEVSVGGFSVNVGGQRIGAVELRWSDRCGTNWARLNLVEGWNVRHLVVQQHGTNYEQVNELLRVGQYHLPAGLYHTNMIYSPVRAARAFVNKPPFWESTLWV